MAEPGSATEELVRRGAALREAGRHAEARGALEGALLRAPDHLAARLELGLCELLAGRPGEALPHLEAVVARAPDHPLGALNLGNALHALGRLAESAALYERAAAIDPASGIARNNLGRALHGLGRHADAVAHLDAALALDPDCELALGNLREALEAQGRQAEVAGRCEEVLARRPGSFAALLHLGIARRESGRHREALECLRAALELRPRASAARLHLGLALDEGGDPDEAVVTLSALVADEPDHATGHNARAGALLRLGKVEEAAAGFGRAAAAAPAWAVAASNRLLVLNYLGRISAATLAAEHRAAGAALEASVRALPPAPAVAPGARRLRLAYLSPDLRAHPVAAFIEPVLAAHDRTRFEVVCYSAWADEDEVSRRLARLVDRWCPVARLGDDELAARIREDRIDVLVDLAGHTGGNRLPVLARRPAPLQATWIGYPNTTGLEAVDLRITDSIADPPGESDDQHAERLLRLPRCFLAFRPAPDAPAPAPLPQDDPRACAFGSFNTLSKLDPTTVAGWAALLRSTPGARLLLKNHSLAHATARARVEGLFAAHGVGSDRLVLCGRVGHQEHLALYDRVGLALDSFPYHGTTTTCEALWQGVPVVTLSGDRHASRVGESLLAALGLPDLVARTWDEYVAIASSLVRDPERLAELKRGLRARMAASPLCDGPGLTRALEAALLERVV